MEEIDDLKSEITTLKQQLVGYEECKQQVEYFKNLALTAQSRLIACQERLLAATATATQQQLIPAQQQQPAPLPEQQQQPAYRPAAVFHEPEYNHVDLGLTELEGNESSHSVPDSSAKKRKLDVPPQQEAVEIPQNDNTKDPTRKTEEDDNTRAPNGTEENPPSGEEKKPAKQKAAASTSSFEDRFEQLKHYKAGHGHTNVPKGYGPLSNWVQRIRRKYTVNQQKPGTYKVLTAERIDKLESIGFQWRLASKPVSFEERVAELRKFKEETGHCNVPYRHPTLGDWVHNIRGEYRRKGSFNEARKKQLEELGFIFESTRKGTLFEDRLEQCAEWRRRYGHLTVPSLRHGKALVAQKAALTKEELSFRHWVTSARQNYRYFQRGERSSLDKLKVKKLEKMGFCWERVATLPEGMKAPPDLDDRAVVGSSGKEAPTSENGASNDSGNDSDTEIFKMMENDSSL